MKTRSDGCFMLAANLFFSLNFAELSPLYIMWNLFNYQGLINFSALTFKLLPNKVRKEIHLRDINYYIHTIQYMYTYFALNYRNMKYHLKLPFFTSLKFLIWSNIQFMTYQNTSNICLSWVPKMWKWALITEIHSVLKWKKTCY